MRCSAERFQKTPESSASAMKNILRLSAGMLLIVTATAAAGEKRVRLLPKLQAGQKMTYLVRYRTERDTKTESNVVAPMVPPGAQNGLQGLLIAEVLDAKAAGTSALVRIRTTLESLDSGTHIETKAPNSPPGSAEPQEPKGKIIEFVILADGRVDRVKGLDALSSEERQAWQEWISRFAAAWTFPAEGVRVGDKWKSEEAEVALSPIAGLLWMREATYVRQEPCRPLRISDEGVLSDASGEAETCAVLLTTATLKQKSSSKDATPEDFKLHDLRTMGTAKGKNETITYISLKTGLVVRATEEANQFMEVVVAMADGSNRVHYSVNAKSHSEVLLVVEMPLAHP